MIITAVKNSEIIIVTNDHEAYKFQLEAGASKILALSRHRRLKGSITSSNVVHVTSTEDIIVYGINCVLSPSDGFLALPISSLGKQYVVASYKPVSASQFAVTAIDNNTHINISLVERHDDNTRSYQEIQLKLDRFQTYHFKNKRDDLTGSIINSDKPVAVISGNKCSRVSTREQHCNFMVEQLLPVKTWGNHFISVPIPGGDQENIYRIISAFNETTVNITMDDDTVQYFTINRGEFREVHHSSNANFYIVTSNPCSVMLYIKGISGKDGFSRAVMMSVTPTEQFSSGQLLNTVGTFDKSVTNYVALITTNNKTTLKMDMSPLPQGLLWKKINNRYYSTLIRVPLGQS